MSDIRLVLPDQCRTEALARALALVCRPRDVIALSGEMGAGKSVFARAFLRALSDDPALDVPSPTFSLVQEYETRRGMVSHYDLWRLTGPGDLEELGWDLALDGIVLVEWPERAEDWLPGETLHVVLEVGEEEEVRVATVSGWPDRLRQALAGAV